MLTWQFWNGYSEKSASLFDITDIVFEQRHLWRINGIVSCISYHVIYIYVVLFLFLPSGGWIEINK